MKINRKKLDTIRDNDDTDTDLYTITTKNTDNDSGSIIPDTITTAGIDGWNSNDNNNDNNDDVLAVNVSDGDDDEISGALGLLVSPNSNSNHELRNSYSNLLKLSRNASANTTSEIVTDDDFDQIVAYKTKSNATSPVSTYSNLSTPKTTRVHERFETFVERDVNNSSAIDNIMDKPVDDINDDSSDDDVNDESNDDNIPLTVKLLGGSNNIANDTILESADDDDSDEFE
mmetsp:Transcript_70335/g.86316  ORF Transcript_70335/g.86316 Transcript_70335/m.86316 type:complete len:230 (+) Transcript_70335:204-893(+)